MSRKLFFAFLFAGLFFVFVASSALAAGSCEWVNGSIVCDDWGSGGGDCGEECTPPPPAACEPGESTTLITTLIPIQSPPVCVVMTSEIDTCTREILWSNTDYNNPVPCGSSGGTNPCDEFGWVGGGFTCARYCDPNWNWGVTTRLGFPQMFLDVRPFPATVVRWDTALRASLMSVSQATNGLDYAPLGGGSEEDPENGDWRNIRLALRLLPAADVLLVQLPQIGSLSLPVVGESGVPTLVHWEKPSHPEAGAQILAGSVDGFEKLPADIPVFQGSGGGLYRLFFTFRYEEYRRRCVSGDNSEGEFECKTRSSAEEKDGHWEERWVSHSESREIPPSAVQGLPAGIGIDLDGDGSPDAYWNSNLTLRRMNEAGSVHDPAWARSWNWGGSIFWAVREGQGQIGWPGSP